MPVIIQSKKTVTDLDVIRSDIVASEARSTADLDAHKAAYNSKVAEIESASNALTDRLAAQETKQEADKVAAKAEHDARVVAVDATLATVQSDFTAHVASFEAEKALRDTQKADLEAEIATAKSEASTAVAAVDSKFEAEKARVAIREADVDASLSAVDLKIDTEKAALQANIDGLATTTADAYNVLSDSVDALTASTSGASGALSARVDELERITGDDLKDTVNSVLTEEVVKTTLDSFLAKDEELSAAVNAAVADRVNVDTEIKAKFDLLVDTLFTGLTFEGVEKSDLKFGADVVEFDGMIKEEHIGLWFGDKYQVFGITAATDTEPQKISLKWDMNKLGGEGAIASMWEIPFDPVTKTYTQVDYGLNAVKFELIDGVLYFAGLPQTN